MRALIVACLIALLQGPLHGASGQEAEQASKSRMRDAGLALGVAGYLAGNWLGAKAHTEIRRARGADLSTCADECGSVGAVILGVLGGSTGVAAGVHLINDSRGDFSREWLTSLGIGTLGTGIVVLAARPWEHQTHGFWTDLLLSASYLVAIPALQLAATIHIERESGDREITTAPRPMVTVRIPLSW